jgi:hypothetical protein
MLAWVFIFMSLFIPSFNPAKPYAKSVRKGEKGSARVAWVEHSDKAAGRRTAEGWSRAAGFGEAEQAQYPPAKKAPRPGSVFGIGVDADCLKSMSYKNCS